MAGKRSATSRQGTMPLRYQARENAAPRGRRVDQTQLRIRDSPLSWQGEPGSRSPAARLALGVILILLPAAFRCQLAPTPTRRLPGGQAACDCRAAPLRGHEVHAGPRPWLDLACGHGRGRG